MLATYADANLFGKGFFCGHKLCSCQNAPSICYILIVQGGIKNAVDRISKGDDGKFDHGISQGD
jgi:hypothetical protein